LSRCSHDSCSLDSLVLLLALPKAEKKVVREKKEKENKLEKHLDKSISRSFDKPPPVQPLINQHLNAATRGYLSQHHILDHFRFFKHNNAIDDFAISSFFLLEIG